MTANKWRGEVEIVLDGMHYTLRPTFEALCRIEQELGAGLLAVARLLAQGQLNLTQLIAIIHHCTQAAGHTTSREVFCNALLHNGLNSALYAVGVMFTRIFAGSDDEE